MNTNRLADPENLYIPDFESVLKKKKINRQLAAILIIGGDPIIIFQVIALTRNLLIKKLNQDGHNFDYR